jgi:hypothetical protein
MTVRPSHMFIRPNLRSSCSSASQQSGSVYLHFGSLADIAVRRVYVRFNPKADTIHRDFDVRLGPQAEIAERTASLRCPIDIRTPAWPFK